MLKELPILRNETVLLRAFVETDIAILQEVALDPFELMGPNSASLRDPPSGSLPTGKPDWEPLIPKITTVPAVYSEDSARAYIERQNDRLRTGEGYSFAICRGEDQPAVGQIGVWVADLAKGRATVGYWIAESARGNGLAGHALHLVSSWAFDILPLHRMTAYVEPWNVGSIRTAESAGFSFEALLRSWELVDGEPKDMLSMSRIR